MNIFTWFFTNVVYLPLLNILQLFYNFTGDVGVSIILLAAIVNLALWPLFASTYITGQKTRILQPQLKAIQEKYKDDPQQLLRATGEFNRKHKINNSSILFVIIGQLIIASGLWSLTNDVSAGKEISGLYSWLFSSTQANFQTEAFGFIQIGNRVTDYIWIPLINSFFSYLYGMYSFRWAPKIKLAEEPKKPAKKSNRDELKPFDPQAMQKTLEFQTIYFMPAFLFFINSTLTAGVNLYFVTVSLISLVRQIALTRFYASHVDKLILDIAESDPSSKDQDADNNLEITADPAQQAALEQPVLAIKKSQSKKNEKNRVKKPQKTKKGKKNSK